MSLASLSIRRPVFISCVVILLLTVGFISLRQLPIDLFPDVNFPVVMINTPYPGAGPEEVETSVSKIIEDELNNIPGIKSLRSENTEGNSQVIAEFTTKTDVKYAEQKIRDKLNTVQHKLPDDAKAPVTSLIDPADKPILILALKSTLPRQQLYEFADKQLKPKLEQLGQVGMVDVLGNSGRQIHVDLDRQKLQQYHISATEVANSIASAGQNIPIGKADQGYVEKIFRALGEYKSIQDIGTTIVRFFGNDVPLTVQMLGKVSDSQADTHSKTYVNGQASILMMVYRQHGANTIAVADTVKQKIGLMNQELQTQHHNITLSVVRDGSKMIRDNVNDVMESIFIGMFLTIIVVYLFLGSARSTFITGLALPTSLIGSFLLMHLAGFSINMMSLLAISLAVGLLVDDAIVVRENIFRHVEKGQTKIQAAISGTQEVTLAVIATTLTVMAVFGPIGFLHGMVGQFFKEFGLTICFAMMISLLDALTIAPMLSAYIGLGKPKTASKLISKVAVGQKWLEAKYAHILQWVLRFPGRTLAGALLIFILSLFLIKFVPKTFLPASDTGEFVVALEMAPGTTLERMNDKTKLIDDLLRRHSEVATAVAIVGGKGHPNTTTIFVNMVPRKQRHLNTTEFKANVRAQLQSIPEVKVVVKDVDLVGGGERPFNLVIVGNNLEELKKIAFQAYHTLQHHKGLVDPEISYKSGKPEVQIIPNLNRLQQLGVSTTRLGQELHTQIEGTVPAVYHDHGQEYDILVRLQADQRDLEQGFAQTMIPNINNLQVPLSEVATAVATQAPVSISRKDRQRNIRISSDLAPDGPGLATVMQDCKTLFEQTLKLPPGVSYMFEGDAENFAELMQNMTIALGLGVLFIYLVLASLYESFVTPFTIMLVLPLAACGAFFALLITRHSLDIFSMIGCILLLGIATKNSILLVDYIQQLIQQGKAQEEAIIEACSVRLRPILMTTIALIAGMLPIAIGLNEASKPRTSMGIAVIGGLLSSTILTLVVVPATYAFMEKVQRRFHHLWQRYKRSRINIADSSNTKTTLDETESLSL